jgi:Rad3-related DNA helicase
MENNREEIFIDYLIDSACDLSLQTEDDDTDFFDVLLFNEIVDPSLDEILTHNELNEVSNDVTDEQGNKELEQISERLQRRDARIRKRVEKRIENTKDRLEGERLKSRLERLNRRVERWERRMQNGGTTIGKLLFKIKCILCKKLLLGANAFEALRDILKGELKNIITKMWELGRGLETLLIYIVSTALKSALNCKNCS